MAGDESFKQTAEINVGLSLLKIDAMCHVILQTQAKILSKLNGTTFDDELKELYAATQRIEMLNFIDPPTEQNKNQVAE